MIHNFKNTKSWKSKTSNT